MAWLDRSFLRQARCPNGRAAGFRPVSFGFGHTAGAAFAGLLSTSIACSLPQLRLARQQTVLEKLRQRMRVALDSQLKQASQRQRRVAQRLNQQNQIP